ncbi:MAG: hypothetical protein LBR53_02190 [Deltaproteobacteria bacterium]|nr:hypothetical protein [Deltaproteobacteria bacterium]
MKKSLALLLGIVIGVALSIPAFAASPVEFEGYVKVYHENLHNFQRNYEKGYDDDSFFWNRLNIKVTFQPSDAVKVVWQFRAPDNYRWGQRSPNTTAATRAVYGELNFDWGTIRGGRIIDGLPGTVGGLASLGYAPSWGADGLLYNNIFDYNTPVDALTYDNKWDLSNGHKFGLAVYYDKLASNWSRSWDNSATGGNSGRGLNNDYAYDDNGWFTESHIGGPLELPKDADYDIFGVEATYEWETGGASLGVEYQRNATSQVSKEWALFLNPAFVQSFGPFAIHFEGKIGWGKKEYNREYILAGDWTRFANAVLQVPDWNGTIRNKGLGLYLDGVYTYDQGDVTLSGWYVSGTDLNTDRTSLNSLVTLGDFAPFLVAFNDTTLGRGYFSNNLGTGVYDGTDFNGQTRNINTGYNEGTKNQWGIAILGHQTIVPDFITLNYGIGYFRLVKPTFYWIQRADGGWNQDVFTAPGQTVKPQSKDLGWEIDLGFSFQIFENVYFDTQFGYMFNGSAYDDWDPAGAGSWKSAKDTFAWANVLAFQF